MRWPRAMSRHRKGLVSAVLPASVWNMCKRTSRVLQELGRSCRFLSEVPAGATGSPTPGFGGALVRRGANRTSGRRDTAKRRQRSAARWATGSHSALMVPRKLANGSHPEPVEGSEASDQGTALGKHDECFAIRQTCLRNRSGLQRQRVRGNTQRTPDLKNRML
jgi:hypothetical protein